MKNGANRSIRGGCLVLALLAAPLLAGAQTPAATAQPAPPAALSAAEAGYLIGVNFGAQMHKLGFTDEVRVAALARGLKDGLAGKTIDTADQQRLHAFVQSVMQASVERNKAAAREFLARNAQNKGVKTTASGLQYKIIDAGDATAAAPAPADLVTVQYRGRLLDGKEFDSSYAHGVPASFPVDAVIKGWQEALLMMKPGAKWELFIPPELGYGMNPRPGIPPGSLLIFDVNLLSVKRSAVPVSKNPG